MHSTAIRQQELCELLQAASELRKALDRAQTRTKRKSAPPILPQHFDDLIKATRFVESSLETLVDAHEGDVARELPQIMRERKGFPGWEGWISIVQQHLCQLSVDERAERAREEAASLKVVNS